LADVTLSCERFLGKRPKRLLGAYEAYQEECSLRAVDDKQSEFTRVPEKDFPPMHDDLQPRISILLQSLQMGGAERTMLTLADGLSRNGCQVDFLLVVKRGELLDEVPRAVRLVELGTVSRTRLLPCLVGLSTQTLRLLLPVLLKNRQPKVVRSLPKLIRYLQSAEPDALLTTLPNNNLVAVWAKWLCRPRTRIVVCEGNTTSKEVSACASNPFDRKWPILIKEWYPHADNIVAVSDGVAKDLGRLSELPPERITTVFNGVDLHRLDELAASPVEDPWFEGDAPPVLLAAGRLAPQKDFPNLLKAFARVRSRCVVRLVILGEGPERARLESLAAYLGIAADVKMPGAVLNPFSYMARARLFVLSSAWEGLPTVLLEALACGCPIVSTDCPSGPTEILDGGAFGPLVRVGDDEALAEGIIRALASPADRGRLRERAQIFSVHTAVDRYLKVLLGGRDAAEASRNQHVQIGY
jgi:glycosyltransferase involved in cell wall biosynthesis